MAQINAPRVLEIAELAALIFGYTELPVCARMCRVSRSMFYAAAPIAWKRVKGVHRLLKLFPEIFVHTPAPCKLNIIIPDSIALNTSRFELYAPFVKSLEVYGRNMDYTISGWGSLLALSSQRSLFPNLLSLTMTKPPRDKFWCISLWVQVFASESLTTISSIPTSPNNTPSISHRAFSVAIKTATERCPRLQKVMLFLAPVTKDFYEEDTPLDLLYDKPYHHYLLPTLGIREMTCSLRMLEEEDGLNALSELSLLEHLAVYSYGFVPQSHTQLSDHSFPSLRYLNLNLFSQMEADWTLLRLRNLLKGLTTLKVLISNPFGLPSPRWFTESLLPALAHATYLEHLAVDFPDRPYRGAAIEVENMSALSVLSRLPLTTVRFSPIGLQRVDASVAFEAVWSKVTYLDLPETNISLKGLPLFTRFPMLEHLVIQLYIDPRDLPEDGDLHETTGSCLHTLEGGKFSETEHCEDKDTQLQIARFLLSLWPTLNQVLWPKIVDRGVGASRQRRVVKSLNRELRALKNK